MADPLARGAFPGLRKLSVLPEQTDENECGLVALAACEALATAVRSGYCCHLRELTLQCVGGGGVKVLAEALREGNCPALTHLALYESDYEYPPSDWEALHQLLRSPACLKLEVLVLSGHDYGGGRLVPVIEALRTGACSGLAGLSTIDAYVSVVGVTALAGLLLSGSVPKLQTLDLSRFAERGGRVLPKLFERMQSEYLPNLRRIDLSQSCAGDSTPTARRGRATAAFLKGGALYPI